MNTHHGKIKILTGNSYPKLAKRIANELSILYETRVELVKVDVGTFPNREISARVAENVRGCDVFLMQSLHYKDSISYIEETEFLTDCIKDSARRITGIFPWIAYSKQDRKTVPRESRSFKVIAKRLSICGLNRVVLCDLHNSTTADFFDIPNDRIYLMRIIIEEIKKREIKDIVIGAPDIGAAKRADAISQITDIKDICVVRKIHDHKKKKIDFEKSDILGNVEGRDVWFFDDMIQTFETLETGSKIAKRKGAKSVIAAAVHPDFTPATKIEPSAIERIERSDIDEVIVINTIPLDKDKEWSDKITILGPENLLAECISKIHEDKSLSSLFLKY